MIATLDQTGVLSCPVQCLYQCPLPTCFRGKCRECRPRYMHPSQVKCLNTHQLVFAHCPETISQWKRIPAFFIRWKPLAVLDQLQIHLLLREAVYPILAPSKFTTLVIAFGSEFSRLITYLLAENTLQTTFDLFKWVVFQYYCYLSVTWHEKANGITQFFV